MKTAEERAKSAVDGLVAIDNVFVNRAQQNKIEKMIIKLLKEQDKLTRHACADACMEVWKSPLETVGQQTTKVIFSKVCMNVKAT